MGFLSNLSSEIISTVAILEKFGEEMFTKAEYDKASSVVVEKWYGTYTERSVDYNGKKYTPHTIEWLFENGFVTRTKSEPFKKTIKEWDYSKREDVEKEIEVFRYEYKVNLEKLNALKPFVAMCVA